MECKYTCFDRVMHLVKSLPENTLYNAYEIIVDGTFIDFLDYCVKNNCFTKSQAETLYEGIIMWEDLDGNHWEEDYDKLINLYNKVGLTEELRQKFDEDYSKEIE